MPTVDMALVRLQCNVIADVDDVLLQHYVDAALAHAEQHCDRHLVDGDPADDTEMALTPDVLQAALLLVGHWCANKEAVVVGEIPVAVQLGFERLLWYRKTF
jgi:hypothetical protein